MKLSARNQLSGTVTSINEGAAIANVELDVNGQRLVASITVEAARELGLEEGTTVTAIVKASDVILAPPTERDQDLHARATGCSQAAARRRRSSRGMVEIHAHRAGPLSTGSPSTPSRRCRPSRARGRSSASSASSTCASRPTAPRWCSTTRT